jgi:hypothetical protein
MLSSFAVCATCGLMVPDTIMQAAITAFQLRGKQIAASLNTPNGQFPHIVVFCSTNTRKLQNQLALLTCSEKDWKVDRATMASLA